MNRQISLSALSDELSQARTKKKEFLEQMDSIIPWGEWIDWADNHDIHVVYIRHENLSAGTRTFKPNTPGAELAPDLKIVSENVFTK